MQISEQKWQNLEPNMINPYSKQKGRRLLFELEQPNPGSSHKNS